MKTWHWIALALLTILSLVVELTMVHHGKHWWSSIPGFYIILGFVSCIVTVYFAKWVGKVFLYKEEGYYDQ